MSECWCGESHDVDTTDPNEAVRNLWHVVIATCRIPQVVEWLNDRLSRRS